MSTANKLTYLNTTKGKIKDSINLTGANIGNSDTFRSYSAKLRDGLVDVINDGGKTLYNNFPKVTGTGSSATLNNTYQAPMKIALNGNTYQGENPTPSSPQDIEVVTGYNEVVIENEDGTQSQSYEVNLGKNLFDKDNANILNATINSSSKLIETSNQYKLLYISCKPNTIYTISKIQSNYLTIGFTDVLPNINVKVKNYVNSSDTTKYTNTSLSTSKYIVVRYWRNNDTLTEQQILDSIQIEEGSKVTPYSAYKTPIKMCKIPNTDYKDEIRRSTGKNLFDKSNLNTDIRTYNSLTELPTGIKVTCTTAGTFRFSTVEIPNGDDLLGKTVTFHADCKRSGTQNFNAILYFISDTSIISAMSPSTSTTASSIDFTATIPSEYPANADKIAMVFYSGTTTSGGGNISVGDYVEFTNIQLEQNNQATDYEPYGVGVWYKYNRIGKKILNGSETWSKSGTYTNSYFSNIADSITIQTSDTRILTISDNYKNTYRNNILNYDYSIVQSNDKNIMIHNKDITSKEDFATWLSTHNTIVYYVLANPTITTLDAELQTQLEDIYNNAKSYLGQTNITAEYISGNQPFIMDVSALLKEE